MPTQKIDWLRDEIARLTADLLADVESADLLTFVEEDIFFEEFAIAANERRARDAFKLANRLDYWGAGHNHDPRVIGLGHQQAYWLRDHFEMYSGELATASNFIGTHGKRLREQVAANPVWTNAMRRLAGKLEWRVTYFQQVWENVWQTWNRAAPRAKVMFKYPPHKREGRVYVPIEGEAELGWFYPQRLPRQKAILRCLTRQLGREMPGEGNAGWTEADEVARQRAAFDVEFSLVLDLFEMPDESGS